MTIIKSITKSITWAMFDRFLRVLEVVAMVVAATIVLQIPGQMNEWRSSQEGRSMDLLLRLESKLNSGNNYKIALAIDKYKPILRQNKGPYSTDDLDQYLNDLTSVSDAYQRELISSESLNNWFSDYFVKVDKNKEVRDYLIQIRKDDPEYYTGIDYVIRDIYSLSK